MIDNFTFWFAFVCGFLFAWILFLTLSLFRGVGDEKV